MFFLQEGFTYRNFPLDSPRDILLRRVVLAAHYCCFRSIPTSRRLQLGQGKLGDRVYNISIPFRAFILDLSGNGHGGA